MYNVLLTFIIFAIIIAIVLALIVIYFLIYRRYLNKRLNGECKKRQFPTLQTTQLIVYPVLIILLIVGFSVPLKSISNENAQLQHQLYKEHSAIMVVDFENSPYRHYRDLIISGEATEYHITSTISKDFSFYLATFRYSDNNSTVYYPPYICYIKYANDFADDVEMTVKYVYSDKNGVETTGEPMEEFMLLSRSLEQLPQRIIITLSLKGSKLEPHEEIESVTFEIYSIK